MGKVEKQGGEVFDDYCIGKIYYQLVCTSQRFQRISDDSVTMQSLSVHVSV